MLCLDIEWLLDTCFATRSPADDGPEWPPQPDRVYSALVASWGARGTRDKERTALEWLEGLPPPQLRAVACGTRTVVTAYVPPNDTAPHDLHILPERRRRQPRRFPAATLPRAVGRPHLRLIWSDAEPSADCRANLAALAQDTSYVGHSSSLVRCRFHGDDAGGEALDEHDTVAAPYSGRLHELETLHALHQQLGDASARPRPAPLPRPLRAAPPDIPRSVFGERWIVLEHAGSDRPDMRAAAVWGRAMRDTLQKHWRGNLPEWLSGHAADGTPSRMPHLAVLSLGFVGFPQATGAWQGMALVLPRAVENEVLGSATPAAYAMRQRFDAALASAAGSGGVVKLHVGKDGAALLRVVSGPPRPSLSPRRYVVARQVWSTVTPIALDRHPDPRRGDEEAAEVIAAACLRIGLPTPSEVRVHKHPAITGAISAWPVGGAPRWTGWARPGPLANRPLTHATLRFDTPVAGPVILGSGRYFGLGLCLPGSEENTP